MKYHCVECGKEAFVREGSIIRTCAHVASGVAAELSAHATGVGGTVA